MKVGKLTVTELQELIFKKLKNNRREVISSPEIGGDCAIVDFGDKVAYLSTDPITGTSKGIGKLAVNINCNDIATGGVEPLGLMVTILVPPETKKEEIADIMEEIQEECEKLNISVLGGHTEVTPAVNRVVISATAIGIGSKEDYISREKVVPGDKLVITKGIGIEGTGIISFEKEEEIMEVLGEKILLQGKSMLDKTSVVKDGVIGSKYCKGMHDVTEGGLLGAVWEMSELYKLGTEIYGENLRIDESTLKICEYYKIDPLRLISSGTMLMVVADKNVKNLLLELQREGIEAYEIGKIIEEKANILIKNGKKEKVTEPESDELYKVI